jgi:hypothetical protein
MSEIKIPLDLTPDTSIMDDIGAGNLAVHEAIGEIVANSFDARIDTEGTKLEVVIETSATRVSIIDNARGISVEEIERALTLSDKRQARADHEKGKYGWGLKASSSTIGFNIEISTRPAGENYEIYFKFPIRQLRDKKLTWKDLSAISQPHKKDGPLGDRKHGTAIDITDLRHSGFNKGDLDRHLRFTYAPHLKNGDSIVLNGLSLEPWEPVVIDSMRHEISKTFGKNNEFRVTGWIGVGKTQSSGEYGLNIYRKNQLVEAWNKDAFTSKHQMTSRVVGQIEADFVPTNFNKKGFNKESTEWKELMRLLREEIGPFLNASRNLGRNKDKDMRVKVREASEQLAKQLALIDGWKVTTPGNWPSSQDLADDKTGNDEKPDTAAKKDEESSGSVEDVIDSRIATDEFPNSFTLEGIGKIEISLRPEPLGDPDEHWSYMQGEGKLLAVLNSDSPLTDKYSGEALGVIQAIATSEAIQEFLITVHGFNPLDARRIRNQYLTRVLAPEAARE